jgi:DNA-binding transcriptional LysR family regulator
VRAEDLSNHSCLVLGERAQWSFARKGADITVRVGGPLKSNNGDLLCLAAIDGNGLIYASELEIMAELASGQLVEVLTDHEITGKAAVWALYPSIKHMLPRMRVLLDFLTEWFRDARPKAGNGPARKAPPSTVTAKAGLHPS